jgi:hypothetical protein
VRIKARLLVNAMNLQTLCHIGLLSFPHDSRGCGWAAPKNAICAASAKAETCMLIDVWRG